MTATATATGEHPDSIRSWDIGGAIVEVVETEQGPAIGLWASEHPDRRLSAEDARGVARALLEATDVAEHGRVRPYVTVSQRVTERILSSGITVDELADLADALGVPAVDLCRGMS